MASTFSIGPNFKWYFLDSLGRPAVGGKIYYFEASNQTVPKPVYKDALGKFKWDNPIDLDGTGATPVPIYFEDDGSESYYILVNDADGNKITDFQNYLPAAGGGGGGSITQNIDIENALVNGQFHFINNQIFDGGINLGTSVLNPISPVPEGITPIAPGGGTIKSVRTTGEYTDGSSVDVNNKLITVSQATGWFFLKTGGAALTDTIEFVAPNPGVGNPGAPSANAPRYFKYVSTNALASTDLDLMYILGDVRAYSGKTLQVSFDAFADGPAPMGTFTLEQNFGTGGAPSGTVLTTVNFNYPNNVWDRVSFTIAVPSIAGKSIGDNLDDSLRFRWGIPANNLLTYGLTDLQIVETQVGFPGITDFIYEDYNKVASRVLAELIHGHLPKTGDIKWSVSPNPTAGWIVTQNVGDTIGSAGSTATFKGEALRNLYRLVYDSYTNAQAPVAGGRGASADADFDLNKNMTLPAWVDRVIGSFNAGRLSSIGDLEGSATHTLTSSNLTSHLHSVTTGTAGVGPERILRGSSVNPTTSLQTENTGGSSPFSLLQPTAYLYLHIKL